MNIKTFFINKFESWLAKRIPAKSQHTLTSKNIFIFPTTFGFTYLLFVLLLFLLGTNYQNNLIILFSFFLASFFVTVMLHSFFNFSGLTIHSEKIMTGYCDQRIDFPIYVEAQKEHFNIHFAYTKPSMKTESAATIHVQPGSKLVNLPVFSNERGQYSLGRITVSSEYSFGLFRSWSKLDFGHTVLVYPKQRVINNLNNWLSSTTDESNLAGVTQSSNIGIDEFSELKSFIQGESLARTAWKQLAKGQGHFTKHYQSQQGEPLWLTLDNLPTKQLELQLQYLSYLVNKLTISNQEFGLLLSSPGKVSVKIEPSLSKEHKQQCLTALAMY